MQLFDTHCHIHESDFTRMTANDPTRSRWAKIGNPVPGELVKSALEHDVNRLLLIGCTLRDSQKAVEVAQKHDKVWASIGIHPHEAAEHLKHPEWLEAFAKLVTEEKVVAVGECGLDYYYEHSPREAQEKILRFQLELAQKHKLPLSFHVREAFDDFWPILNDYKGVKGVLHSFTDTQEVMEQALERGLYIALNGIMTFTKDASQLAMAKAVPTGRLLLETDAPFLTPAPERGTICIPKHVRVTAQFLAALRGESLAELADYTTKNARRLFDV